MLQKPMLPTLSEDVPTGEEWSYEVKYDGFRTLLHWTEEGITLWSRNGKPLHDRFPEIVKSLSEWTETISSFLPLQIDGEIVIKNTPYQANFPLLQMRNRMRNTTSIQTAARHRPSLLMCFDITEIKGASITKEPLSKRRSTLSDVLESLSCPRLELIQSFPTYKEASELVFLHLGEGVVAKRVTSPYAPGERSADWIKIKHWRTVSGFLQQYDTDNGYYHIGVYNGDAITKLGSFKHGLSRAQQQTLRQFVTEKGIRKNGIYNIPPAVCLDVHCLHAQKDDLREPMFNAFRFDLSPEECTMEKVQWDLSLYPHVDTSNEKKWLWKSAAFTKQNLLIYLRLVAPYMLPYLRDKRLTVIRYPDGVDEDSFYQKHLPDYAPDFIQSVEDGEEVFMVCQNLHTLLWLGNQAALEYHIPFNKEQFTTPDEIVFDLDPPDRESFSLAIRAAKLLKLVLDELQIKVFIKASGNKGMQLHIPIPEGSLSYEETRSFTEQLARLLVKQEPELFTMERLKKNRGRRLYIDYIQHAEGKTIICPFSPRATAEGTVAMPLFWNEVDEGLSPLSFTICNALDRLKEHGNAFAGYNEARTDIQVKHIKKLIEP
ncbi:DNA ligase D [Pontibacillus salicampi]|uniref:DNA ligase (ATP) n=1 Tax=Pontibacillus salicampi TaxID=1449801 RepID=A0ABV6LS19_9BACI